ncbi:MAG: SDR family NAD(P)-dependent oxidoreductase [bacterium]
MRADQCLSSRAPRFPSVQGQEAGLSDRVVIITGAAGGLGLACARRFVDEGDCVLLADATGFPANALSHFASSANVETHKTDVTSSPEVERLVAAAVSRFGRVDVLVNNAALFTTLPRTPFEKLTAEDWQRVLSVNVIGAFNCIRAVAPSMKVRQRGKIINIASNVVHKGLPLLLHYVASKGAVVAMTRALARELGPFGICVNAIAPGYLLHEGTLATDQGRNEIVKSLRSLNRTETPEDVVGTVLFLASEASDFMTGQTLVVDGGEVFA